MTLASKLNSLEAAANAGCDAGSTLRLGRQTARTIAPCPSAQSGRLHRTGRLNTSAIGVSAQIRASQ